MLARLTLAARRGRLAAVALAALIVLFGAAACGSDGPSFDDVVSGNAGSDQSSGDFRIDALDLEVDEQEGGDGFTATFGDASTAMGTDLDRPDWLDGWVVLPDGLSISLAVDDPSTGERYIHGLVDGSDVAGVRAQQQTMMEAAGFRPLQESGYFIAPGRMPVQITLGEVGDGTIAYVFEHSFEEEQTLIDLYDAIEGRGTMTAWINNEVLSWEGDCTVRSTSGQFASDDGMASMTVEERDGEQDYVLANIVKSDPEAFDSWQVLQEDASGRTPSISVRPDSFQLDGPMVGIESGETFATIEVKCAR